MREEISGLVLAAKNGICHIWVAALHGANYAFYSYRFDALISDLKTSIMPMPKTINQYDASYKKLFSNQEIVISLLQGFLPAEILARLDLSSLKPMPTEHITHENNERKNDLLWKAKYGDAWCYLLIMLEFQSVEDWWMAVRISAYSALILQDIIKYEKLKKGGKLPLIFPFVIYNGDKKWQAP